MAKVRLGPDGVHIFDRNTGTNILLDEVTPIRSKWTQSPRQVSIALINSCDLECTHCYAPKLPARLNTELVKQWLVELDKVGCFGIGFGGGEPTLHPDILELCHFGMTETNLAITMTTHGHRLSGSVIETLKESVSFLRISMDGKYNTYEKIRGRSFSSLLRTLELINGMIPFGVNYVVNESTIAELPIAIKLAEKYQASEFLLLPEVAFGRGKAVEKRTLKQLSDWLKTYSGDVQLSISSSHAELAHTQAPLPNEIEELAYAHIDANGILKRCSFDTFGEVIGREGVMHAFGKLIQGKSYEIME